MFGPADQNKEFCFDGFCGGLYPSARIFEEFPEHCNNFINAQLFIGFSEPAGYMTALCHTKAIRNGFFVQKKVERC